MRVPGYRSHWLSLVLTYHGSALPRVQYRLLAVLVLSLLSSYMQERGWWQVHLTTTPFTLVGLALGIFLGFRNNTSYDRFWEGRRLWGALVNTTRSFSRQILAFLPGGEGPSPLQRELIYRVIGWVYALRDHLREGARADALAPWLGAEDRAAIAAHKNLPAALSLRIALTLREQYDKGHLSDFRLIELERRLVELTDIQGGCERIKSTPIPFSYSVLIHRIVAIYVFALPFGLVDTLHFFTPIVVLIVAYTFLALDAVGDEIEDPFGTDPNDLPLSALARTIEINLRQALGETDVPSPVEPVDGFLS